MAVDSVALSVGGEESYPIVWSLACIMAVDSVALSVGGEESYPIVWSLAWLPLMQALDSNGCATAAWFQLRTPACGVVGLASGV